MDSLGARATAWMAGLRYEDLPADVVEAVDRLDTADSLAQSLALCG